MERRVRCKIKWGTAYSNGFGSMSTRPCMKDTTARLTMPCLSSSSVNKGLAHSDTFTRDGFTRRMRSMHSAAFLRTMGSRDMTSCLTSSTSAVHSSGPPMFAIADSAMHCTASRGECKSCRMVSRMSGMDSSSLVNNTAAAK